MVGTIPLVFLGGTCGKNNWRQSFTERLIAGGVSAESIFNPVVPDWTPECQAAEENAKAKATASIFYIADPGDETVSAYSMVEATMALYDQQHFTVVVFDDTGMEGHRKKAMTQCYNVLKARFPDARIYNNADDAIAWLTK